MTTFVYTWNSTFLNQPADTEDESLGAQRIRDTKAATGERLAVDHSLAGDANDGKHTFATLRNTGTSSAYTLDSGDGRVFASNNVTGGTELFYQDSAGNVIQLTNAGRLNTVQPFASGTVVVFAQASPPTGWTLVNWNDAMLRFVNDGSGGGGGGGWVISGGSVASHTLALSEIPSHDHGLGTDQLTSPQGGGGSSVFPVGGGGWGLVTFAPAGSNGGHSHGLTFDGSWRPAYINVIGGQKT